MIARLVPIVGGVREAEEIPSEQALAILDARRAELAELALAISTAILAANPEVKSRFRKDAIEHWQRAAEAGAWIEEAEEWKAKQEEQAAATGLAALRAAGRRRTGGSK